MSKDNVIPMRPSATATVECCPCPTCGSMVQCIAGDPVTYRALRAAEDDQEWRAIRDEMLATGATPSAFDVSEEQRRRARVRGQ